MKALVINEAGELRIVRGSTLEDLQEIVGGYIEFLRFPGRNDVACFVNEDGKLIGLPENRRATEILSPLYPGDFIAGPLVICGFDPESGENRELPADVLTDLMTRWELA